MSRHSVKRTAPAALGIVLAAMLAATSIAHADEAADRETCFKGSGDTAIAACTRRIATLSDKTDKNSRHNLAVVHYSRGYELLAKKDNKRALADFEASWKADSSYTQALLARGIAKKRLGDEKGGEADMAQAKKLDPSLAK
jgi:tetratricopeptide (TPR) repeat protein